MDIPLNSLCRVARILGVSDGEASRAALAEVEGLIQQADRPPALWNIQQTADFLGVQTEEVARLERMEGLPVVTWAGPKRLVRKYRPEAIRHWCEARERSRLKN